MPGRMLAINEGFGYRPIMIVRYFNLLPQLNERPATTFIYGEQIMFPSDNPTGYASFLRNFYGMTLPWNQLGMAVDDTIEMVYALYPRMPLRPVMEEHLTLLSAGKDPVAGYYVQFAGAMRLFSQPDWWVDGDDFQE